MTVPVWQPGTIYLPGDVVQPATAPVVAAVALSNPGFESGTTDWTMGSFTIATDKVFAGTNSAKCVTAGAPEVVHSSSAVVPGVSITASCMFNQGPASAGQNSGRVVLIWYNSISVEISRSEGNNVTSSSGGVDGWKPSTVTASAPSGAAFVAVAGVTLKLTSQAVWFDAFSWNYVPSSATASFIYIAIQAAAGSSGSSEPVWPVVLLGTVVDNQVTWEAHSSSRLEWTASSILVSGATEPTWPVGSAQTVSDNTIAWVAVVRNVDDPKCPNTKVVAILADKVYSGDDDIVAFSATTNPLDWSTVDDAGFLPTGLQQFGANPMAVLQPYRGNLAAFNSQGLQVWQVDQDPARMALLDAFPVGSTYYQAASPVSNDLLFLTRLGVRTVGIAAGSTNLAAGDIGEPVDVMIEPYIRLVETQAARAFSTYFPSQGQYWLCFTEQTPNYITWDDDNKNEITVSTSELTAYTEPMPIATIFEIIVHQGGDPDGGFALIEYDADNDVQTIVASDDSGKYFQSRPCKVNGDYLVHHAIDGVGSRGVVAYRPDGIGGFTTVATLSNTGTREIVGMAKTDNTHFIIFVDSGATHEAELYTYDGVAFSLLDTLSLDVAKGKPGYMNSATIGGDALFVGTNFIFVRNDFGTLRVVYSTTLPATVSDVTVKGALIYLSNGTVYVYNGFDTYTLQATTGSTDYCTYDRVNNKVVYANGVTSDYRLADFPWTSTNLVTAYEAGPGSAKGFVFFPTSFGFGYDDTDGGILWWNSVAGEYQKIFNFTINEWPNIGDITLMMATVVDEGDIPTFSYPCFVACASGEDVSQSIPLMYFSYGEYNYNINTYNEFATSRPFPCEVSQPHSHLIIGDTIFGLCLNDLQSAAADSMAGVYAFNYDGSRTLAITNYWQLDLTADRSYTVLDVMSDNTLIVASLNTSADITLCALTYTLGVGFVEAATQYDFPLTADLGGMCVHNDYIITVDSMSGLQAFSIVAGVITLIATYVPGVVITQQLLFSNGTIILLGNGKTFTFDGVTFVNTNDVIQAIVSNGFDSSGLYYVTAALALKAFDPPAVQNGNTFVLAASLFPADSMAITDGDDLPSPYTGYHSWLVIPTASTANGYWNDTKGGSFGFTLGGDFVRLGDFTLTYDDMTADYLMIVPTPGLAQLNPFMMRLTRQRTAYVYGTVGQSTGLHYYMLNIDNLSAGEIGVGLALATAIPSNGEYTGVGGFALISSGLLSQNGVETVASTTFTTADVMVVAYNATLGYAWIGKVNGPTVDYEGGGNPVTGTLPTVSGLSGTYYPYFSGAGPNYIPETEVTANFGEITFSPTAPAGYSGWYNGQFTPTGDSEVFVHTINQIGSPGAWSRYVFPFPISYFTQLGNDLYARANDTVYRMDTNIYRDNVTALVAGDLFSSVIQWGYLDFGAVGVTKQMIGFDLSGTGTASIQFGYDQRNLAVLTTSWTVNIDTLPGGILPMPLAAPTISVKLTFAGGEAWEWQSFVAYFNDFRLTS